MQLLAQEHVIRRIDREDWSTGSLHRSPFTQPPTVIPEIGALKFKLDYVT